jgi:outer membrane protein assembly factor BamB
MRRYRQTTRRYAYRAVLLALGLVLALGGTAIAQVDNNWSQFHQGPGFGGQAAIGPDLRLYTTPRFAVGSGLGASFGMGISASTPVVMNNAIFCYDMNGRVCAFSELSGSSLWSAVVAPSSFGSWSSPSADVASNSVYMGSGEYVYRFDATTGASLWSQPYHLTAADSHGETYASVVNAAPTILPGLGLNGQGLVLQHTYGSFGGGTQLHAINVADGSRAWTQSFTGQGQGEVAYNPAAGLIYTTIGTSGGWADGRGGIAALNPTTGSTVWTSAGSFEPLSFGGITYDAAHNRVIAGGYNFYDYAGMLVADGTTGATISYTGDLNAPSGDYRPTLGGNNHNNNLVYVAGAEYQDGPFIFAFDATTGQKVWQSDLGWGGWQQSLAYAGDIGDGTDVVYATDQYGTKIGMFDADTGVLLAEVPYGGLATLANGNLYTIDSDGELLAFGPSVTPEPATLGLLLVGGAALLRRRRKGRVSSAVVRSKSVISIKKNLAMHRLLKSFTIVVVCALVAVASQARADVIPNSATVVPGSLTQGTVKASMSGNAYGQETYNGTNKLNDWPLATGSWAISLTNCDFSSNTLIAFGDGGGITLKFDKGIQPVAGEKEFGIFTAQMVVASNGNLFNGNMEAAILVSQDNVNWYTLTGQAVSNPTTYTAGSSKLNAPTHSYDYQQFNTAWTYGSPGYPAGALNSLTIANYQTPMPNDNLFNGTGTSAQRLALKTDNSTADYDAVYGTSGGGNWFDISQCGLSEVDYVRLNGVNCGGTAGGIRLDDVFTTQDSVVPEPATLALLGLGALGCIKARRR